MSSSTPGLTEANYNPEHFRVLQDSVLIRAGAGAGKTTNLIKTFLQFCEEFEKKSGSLPRVAITTFTRKATQEVKERLSIKALEQKNDKLFQHINKKSAVHISTIHGLLTLFVQDNADRLGLPQNIKILDQNVNKKNLKSLIRHYLKKTPQYLEILESYTFLKLTDLVIQALEALRQSPQLQKLSIEELRLITNKRQSQILFQLQKILDRQSEMPENWNEFKEFLFQLNSFLVANKIEAAVQQFDEKPTKPRWNKKKPLFSEDLHELIENFLKEFDLSVIDTEDYQLIHGQVNSLFLNLSNEVFLADQERKFSTGEITINDLELFSLELVRNHPQAVVDFAEHFDYYMIDEFQDTSPIQVEILDAFVSEKPHFIVGDPQQSIYLFRGARAEVFLLKQKMTQNDDAVLKLQYLDTNYRSQPSLMNFINDYFSALGEQFQPLKTHPQLGLEKSEVVFIQCENEAFGAVQQISKWLKLNIGPQDICVLSRKNSNLVKIAALANKVNIPVHLQMAAGFDQKREILDAIALLKFLVNPHDNENLVLLLRSPWAYLSDLEIARASGRDRSLWFSLNQSQSESDTVRKLVNYFDEYQRVGVSEAFISLIRDSAFLDFSAALDGSGKREANFWKFYIHLKNAEKSLGFSLGKYLNENFQFLQTDLGSSLAEALPVVQPDRVNLMTIHASKGLEFPFVMIVGCAEAPLLTLQMPLAVELNENRISLAPFVVSEAKVMPCRWAQNLRRCFNSQEAEEHERLLYVAMTRAKKGLALVAEDKKRNLSSAWKNKSIWPEIGLHEHQNYKLFSFQASNEIDDHLVRQRLPQEIRSRPGFVNHETQHQSVTDSLTALQPVENQKTQFERKISDILKAKKGTDMHRLFESLQIFSKDGQLLESLQNQLRPEQKKSVQYLLNTKNLPLAELLQVGFAEWGFGIKTKRGLLQGQIDLWGVFQDQIYILDYKTGSSGFSDKAFQQLSFYAACLYRMKLIDENKKLHLIVTYPLEEKTITKSFESFSEFKKSASELVVGLFE